MTGSNLTTDSPGFQIISTLRYDPELAKTTLTPAAYPPPYRSPYYLLQYHYDRILAAAVDFQWSAAATKMQESFGDNLSQFADALDKQIPDKAHPWRLRILLLHNGDFTVEVSPTASVSSHTLLLPSTCPTFTSVSPSSTGKDGHPPNAIQTWTLRLDTEPTLPSTFTKHKTTSREMYNAARERAGIRSPQDILEVLMYNPAREVMEGSITTVYFKKRQRREQLRENEESDGVEWITPPLPSGGNAGTTRRYALSANICAEEVISVDELIDGEEVWLSNGVRGFIPAVLSLP